MKFYSFIFLSLFLSQSIVFSQELLYEVKTVNMSKIEKSAIKRTKHKLNFSKDKKLSTYSYFWVKSNKENTTISANCSTREILNNISLLFRSPETYVFDDSLNVVSIVTKNRIYPNYKVDNKDNLFVKYFDKLKPEIIFGLFESPINSRLFFCYKENNLFIVYLSNDEQRIISTPVSEFYDCKKLFIKDLLIIKEKDLPIFPQK